MTYTIYYDFTFLNEYINIERSNRYKAAKVKRDTTNALYYHFINKPKIATPCKIHYTWIVKSRRMDIDNCAHGAKYLNDAMVKAGLIPNDNLMHIIEVKHSFKIGKKIGVIIETY